MTENPPPLTEAERADEHWAQPGDEDRWGEPVETKRPEWLSVTVSARFSRSEADQIAVAAEAAGMSRPAFVREAALSTATGKVVDVARVGRHVDEAERQLSAARETLGQNTAPQADP